MWLHEDYNCNVFDTLSVYSIGHGDMFCLWGTCGTLCGEQIRSWIWKVILCQGRSFVSFPSHWPSHPYSEVSRCLQVKKNARLKAQTRCSGNSTVRWALIPWGMKWLSQHLKQRRSFYKSCLLCKNPTIRQNLPYFKRYKVIFVNECLNIDIALLSFARVVSCLLTPVLDNSQGIRTLTFITRTRS